MSAAPARGARALRHEHSIRIPHEPQVLSVMKHLTFASVVRRTAAVALGGLLMHNALAQSDDQGVVYTRARLTSSYEEPKGRLYVRLKLLPKAKLPFATQTFRLADKSLISGIPDGASVKFTARRIDGENTVTSLQPASECQRFQPCD
ncbi:conserved hypothetical protein [Burkholderiales bacterium 8X]|nr:conserved hypothetical protein [Burkholderiales bacterium 8X]